MSEDEDEVVSFEKKNITDGEMDITPMIDIVFLLLIFFVVTSKMTAEQAPNVPRAKNGETIEMSNSIGLIITRGGGDTAKVRNDDGRMFSDEPEQQTAEIVEYVTAELEKGKQGVVLRAEGDVKNIEMKRIRDAISEVMEEGQMINISVTHEG